MKTFEEIELIDPLHRALAEESYEIPTPIQAQTIPPALNSRDVLGCAQTGTGKTAAFALPILDRIGQKKRSAKSNRPLALVLAPTRELAIQIGQSFATYGRHLNVRHALVYGGVSQNSQVRALNRGSDVLVATPGRLLDLMNQGHVKLDQLEVFVLDEADRMLDMGFMPDIRRIVCKLPKHRQSLFFSATLAPAIVELTKTLLTDPVRVDVTPKSKSVDKIKQRVIHVARKGKHDLLKKILTVDDAQRAIVFTKTKRTANIVAERLNRSGINSSAIHGNKSQNARQRALDAFRKQFVKVLVATDVAARGIDIEGVTHVINFDLPLEPEAYVHRIGRTGRAGAEGIALSFCSQGDQPELLAIEKLIGQSVPIDKRHSIEFPNNPNAGKKAKGQSNGRHSSRRGQGSSNGSRTGKSNSVSEQGSRNGKRSTKRRRRRNRTEKSAIVQDARRSASLKSNKKTTSRPSGFPDEVSKPQGRRPPRKGKNARQRAKQNQASAPKQK